MTIVPDATHSLVVASCPLVTLRHKVAADALDDYQWRRDPEVARFDNELPINASFSEFLERFEYDLRFPSTERRMFGLDDPEGQHIGNIMYYHANYAAQVAEFGISIGPEACRGQGIGTAATVLFLRYLWQTLPVRRVYLNTLGWNERAQRCFRRAGFGDVGFSRKGDETFLQMEVRREWWLLWDGEGRFERLLQPR